MARGMKAVLVLQAKADGSFTGTIKKGEKLLAKLGQSGTRADGATRGLNRSLGRTAGAAREASTGLAGLHSKVLSYGGLAGAFFALRRAVSGVARATIRQEQALAQVESRIRSTGGAAGYATKEVAAMAAQFQGLTTFGDEEILEAQSILLSFRSVSGEAFHDATAAALNLSVALKQDLKSSVLQLGKALDDPKTGLDALSRSGTKFTDAQKDLIRGLADQGRLAEAQAVILEELRVQYGGAATAARETLGGALTALGNTYGDLLEVSSTHTEALRLLIEDFNGALAEVDVEKLHGGLRNLAWVLAAVSIALAGKGALALTVWGSKAAWAGVKTRGLALAATDTAARLDLVRFRALAGANAYRRYGGAVRGASLAVRGFGRAASLLLGGPIGAVLLAGYALYELSSAGKDATESQLGLADALEAEEARVDALIKKWGELTEAQRRNAILQQEKRVNEAKAQQAAAQAALDEEKRQRDIDAKLAAWYVPGAVGGHIAGSDIAGSWAVNRHAFHQSEEGRAQLVALEAAVDDRADVVKVRTQGLEQLKSTSVAPSAAGKGGTGGGGGGGDTHTETMKAYEKVQAELMTQEQKLTATYDRQKKAIAAGYAEKVRGIEASTVNY